MTMLNSSFATALAIAPQPIGTPRRRLQVVEAPARRRRPKLLYGIIAVLGAFLIAGTQMALSIMTTQTSYELAALAKEQRSLTYDKQILFDDVAGLSSPQYLAANAAALGMVIDESPNYLRLSDGKVLGAGDSAAGASSIDAIGRGVVANELVVDTPLVTAPDATIKGAPVEEKPNDDTSADGAGVADTPFPVTDGLPSPSTH